MPTNRETAAFLRRLASLLELEAVARSRPRILRDAADTVDAFDGEVTAASIADGTIKVGEEPQRELAAWFETGSCALADELSLKFPEGLLEIVAVPGIGASRARALHADLGVDSLEKLVAAGGEGTLTSIRGIGAKSAQTIVAAAEAAIAARGGDGVDEDDDEPEVSEASDTTGSPEAAENDEAPVEEPADEDVDGDPAAEAPADDTQAEPASEGDDSAASGEEASDVDGEAAGEDVDDGDVRGDGEDGAGEAAETDAVEVPEPSAEPEAEPAAASDTDSEPARIGVGIHDPERQGRIINQMRELTGEADAQGRDAEAEAEAEARKSADTDAESASRFLAAMRCGACHATGLTDKGNAVECPGCGKRYMRERGVVDFLVVSGRPSLAQRLMEYPPYAGVYENLARPAATRLVTTRTIEEEIELAADLMSLGLSGQREALVLDVACGPGNFTRRFGERLERSEGAVVGLDVSQSMLDKAIEALERRGDRNVHYVRGDAARLPFGDHSFDAVHCSGALHLMRGIDGVLQEFARVVKPGGVVVIGTFVLGRNPLKRVFKRVTGRGLGFKWFDRKDLKSRLNRVGLEVTEESVDGAALTLKSVRAQASG